MVKPKLRANRDGTFSPVPVGVDDLAPSAYSGQTSTSPWQNSLFDGSKFDGGFGATQVLDVDYWTLRARSSQLFTENLYARGIVRRLVTNEINTGLAPEACPDELVLGLPEDSLSDWTEDVEVRFGLWGKSPRVCDWKRSATFGAIQRAARLEALVSGDVLVVIRQHPVYKTPSVQLISGASVRSPLGGAGTIAKSHTVKHGVECDSAGRVVAHWVTQDDGSSKRIPAYGARTGRRVSWLIYGTDRRLDDLRGQPLLAIVMQSLKEIDRYRDSTQRKAVINSILAMFVKKGEDKMGSLPMTGGAKRRGATTTANTPEEKRTFDMASQLPGLMIEELQHGEEPVLMGGQGTDVNFGTFENAVIRAVSWTLEIPPEVLQLSFANNYSASQAAINEFKIAINRTWGDFGETFCDPIYTEWLLSETLNQKINSPGLLAAWRSAEDHDLLAAWVSCDWYGSIKPSTDTLKQAKGSKLLTDEGWSTNARESRVTTGTKFSKNIKRLARENAQKAEAIRPLLELRVQYGEENVANAVSALEAATDALDEMRENG